MVIRLLMLVYVYVFVLVCVCVFVCVFVCVYVCDGPLYQITHDERQSLTAREKIPTA